MQASMARITKMVSRLCKQSGLAQEMKISCILMATACFALKRDAKVYVNVHMCSAPSPSHVSEDPSCPQGSMMLK